MELENLKFKAFNLTELLDKSDVNTLVFEGVFPLVTFANVKFSAPDGSWITSLLSLMERNRDLTPRSLLQHLNVNVDYGDDFVIVVGRKVLFGLTKYSESDFVLQVYKRS